MTNLETFLLGSFWPGVIVWSVLYISDYTLTLTCARLYRRGVNDKIIFEGSFELTPYFQSDVDALRMVSPRFIIALVGSWVYLAFSWWLATQSWAYFYEFVLGAMISTELAVHIRHFRNFFLFRAIVHSDAVRGRIQYSRPVTLRMSSVELFGFSALFGVLCVFTSSWFLFGGALSCVGIGLKHRRLANKCLAEKAPAIRTASEAVSETLSR